ncbi:MAG: DUF4469 domain-containing protein [Treponema sp.]|jgi:hypothetical protein|nr:DUF4469 domain-containing protein [Treponema sp.]
MAVIDDVPEVLHRIRARLYPNYLTTVEGAYVARTDDEAALSIEKVCAAMKNRGGFTGEYEDAVEYNRLFMREAAYQLCDGFSVNFGGFFTVRPRIGGAFKNAVEPWDRDKHPVRFSFHTLKALRDITQHIEVVIEGVHDGSGYIAEFTDVSTEAENESLTPGGMFVIEGHKLKIAGTHVDNGVYFVLASNPVYREKVDEHYAENMPGKIIGKIPNLAAGGWKLRIITQFAAGGAFTKDPRTIDFAPILTVSAPN